MVEHRLTERAEPVGGRRAGPERRAAADARLLQRALALVEQREGERAAVAEAPVERALADAGGAGDVVHRDVVDAALREERAGGLEDLAAVAGGVGALPRGAAPPRPPPGGGQRRPPPP